MNDMKTVPPVPTMLTIKEAAQKTGLAQHYLRGLCIEKRIVNVRCGKKYLINFEKLIEFLNTGDREEKEECFVKGQIKRIV